MHFLATASRLFADGQVDKAILYRWNADDQCPVNLTRCPRRKCLGEMPCRPGGTCEQQYTRRVLVEPVYEFWSIIQLITERIHEAVDMRFGLGPALRCQARRLVDHQCRIVLVDNQRLRKFHLV